MRQSIRYKSSDTQSRLSKQFILEMGKFLDSKDGLAIATVYFTSDGRAFYNKYPFKVNGKTKYFCRIAMEPMPFRDASGFERVKLTKIGKSEDEIVAEFSAEEIVKLYIDIEDGKIDENFLTLENMINLQN